MIDLAAEVRQELRDEFARRKAESIAIYDGALALVEEDAARENRVAAWCVRLHVERERAARNSNSGDSR